MGQRGIGIERLQAGHHEAHALVGQHHVLVLREEDPVRAEGGARLGGRVPGQVVRRLRQRDASGQLGGRQRARRGAVREVDVEPVETRAHGRPGDRRQRIGRGQAVGVLELDDRVVGRIVDQQFERVQHGKRVVDRDRDLRGSIQPLVLEEDVQHERRQIASGGLLHHPGRAGRRHELRPEVQREIPGRRRSVRVVHDPDRAPVARVHGGPHYGHHRRECHRGRGQHDRGARRIRLRGLERDQAPVTPFTTTRTKSIRPPSSPCS